MMTQVDTWKSVLSILNDSFMEKMNRRNLDLKPHNFCQKVLVRAATLVCQIDVHARLLILGVKVQPT